MNQRTTAPRLTMPIIPVDDPRFVWTKEADVQATWRRYGWVPLSEQKNNADKKSYGTSQL